MAEGFMSQSASCKIIVLLALLQGLFGLLRAYNWVQIGADLFGQGILLLPMVGAVAVMRGLLISVVALLYVLFALGALLGRSWAWWFCLTAVLLNLLLFVSGLVQGAPVAQALAWAVIPIILLFYLFSQKGRDAVKGV
jgi:hypothetical protein